MFKENLSVYFAEFGETVLINGQAVRAIFDREYADDDGFGFTVANTDPHITLADADIPADIRNAVIEARGQEYDTAEIAADGTGITVIQLRSRRHAASDY